MKKIPKLPTYNRLEHGRDAYIMRSLMPELIPHSVRYWKVAGRLVSLQLKGGGVVKATDCFPDYAHSENDMLTFLDQCLQIGVVRPSSYADLFAQRFNSPRVTWTYNSFFTEWFAGGWEQARRVGLLSGTFNRYDLNSAYLWSLTQGLPHVDSFRYTDHIEYEADDAVKPGLYLISLGEPHQHLPYPFNLSRPYVIASHEEIETYELRPTVVHSGVTFRPMPTVQHMVDLIYDTPCPKFVARSYWGRWVSSANVHCHATSTGNEWPMRNPILNVVWAHLIVSRVKLRVWRDCPSAAHVFVDSVITEHLLPTGVSLGDWRLEERYLSGVQIRGPGIYGPPTHLTKHAGAKRG